MQKKKRRYTMKNNLIHSGICVLCAIIIAILTNFFDLDIIKSSIIALGIALLLEVVLNRKR